MNGQMSDSELRGGSLRLCRLRTMSIGPCVTSIDYVLVHTRFMESRKLSSFDSHRVGRYFTSLAVMHTGIVYDHPRIAQCVVSREKRTLGKGGTRPDSLIVVMNYGHMSGLGGLACVVLPGFPLQSIYWFESPWYPLIWVMAWSLCPNVEVLFHYVHMRFMIMSNYDYLVVENNDTKNGWLSYHACLA
jgi:hypothetical protein